MTELPYIFVTAVAGQLAGDQCRWALWFKANRKYEKYEPRQSNLTEWSVKHGKMVEDRAAFLRLQGFHVNVEGQNWFRLKGKTAVLGGKPDIVAVHQEEGVVRIEDCKTGRPKDEDIWQVRQYLYAVPKTENWSGFSYKWIGQIVYREWADTEVTCSDDDKQRIAAMVRVIAGPEPKRAPSEPECRYCNIGPTDCPDRGKSKGEAETTDF